MKFILALVSLLFAGWSYANGQQSCGTVTKVETRSQDNALDVTIENGSKFAVWNDIGGTEGGGVVWLIPALNSNLTICFEKKTDNYWRVISVSK